MIPYYLGIDVSKGYADFIILNQKKQPMVKNFQIDDTFEGHSRLFDELNSFTKQFPDAVIYACVESTGGYENNWYNALIKLQSVLNIQTARLNPLGVNANSKADLKRNSTDKISALNIAEYMIGHSEKIIYQQEDYFGSLRKQWSFIKMLKKQSTQLLNQLESLLYTSNPEILMYSKDGMPDWVLKLLIKYPTSLVLGRAKKATIAKIPYISTDRAKILISNARQSVASSTDSITAQLIVATAKQIVQLKKTIKEQTLIMAKECSLPEIDLLKTFIGISDYSAIGLMLEIQAISRFSNVKKLASFFGLHPIIKTSGDGSKQVRMSKQGRKEPRHILFMVALSATQKNSLIKDIYEGLLSRGMEKMAAMGYCMHKILRIIYGMLKHNTPFDPTVDLKNRERRVNSKKRNVIDKNRRIQDYDRKAPISRRQNKKRMEQMQSQSDNITIDGIKTSAPLHD